MKFTLAVSILLAGLATPASFAGVISNSDLQSLEACIHAGATALMHGDAEVLAELSHPAIVAMAGGKSQFIERTRKAIAQTKANNIEVIGVDSSPPQCDQQIPDHGLCFIPLVTTIKVEGALLKRITSYMVAVRDAETANKWLFLNGSIEHTKPGAVRKLLEWIPESIKFPSQIAE